MIQRVQRFAAAAAETPGVLFQAALAYNLDLPAIVRRFILSIKRKYTPREALLLGMLDPAPAVSAFEKVASKSAMLRVQNRLNPPSWRLVLSDKGMFYRLAAAAGLPVPRLLATYERRTHGWSMSGRPLVSDDDWTRFFFEECPPDLVIKPSRSSYGNGVRVFHRQGDVLVDGEGRGWSAKEISQALRDDSRRFHVIQERVFNHENLAVLSGGLGLQTVRAVTYLQRSGAPRVVTTFFRSVVGSNWIDNHDHGATGNLIISVDREDGRMVRAVREGVRFGFLDVHRHPDTGRVIAGQTIPYWPQVLELAERAALVFAPIRTIGWDIAVTPTGPILIEGNFWYDPPNVCLRMNEVFSLLTGDAPPVRIAG